MQRSLFALVALSVTLFAAGCGEKDEPEVSGGGTTSTEDVQTLEITASGGDAPAYEVAGELQAGVTEISLTNDSSSPVDGQLALIDGERTDQEVAAELKKAVSGQAVADWFRAAGGAGQTPPGKTTSVTQVLEPGKYYVLPGDEAAPTTSLASFEIGGEGGAELPAADGTVEAAEYAFAGDAKAGPGATLELSNTGDQWHHFIAAPIIGDATIEDVKKFFKTEKGKPPVDFQAGGVESTVMDGGISQIVETDLKPGRYMFACFISDRQGGPPHIAKGMVSEVTVK